MATIKNSQEISYLFESGKFFSNKYVIFIVGPIKTNKSTNEKSQHGLKGRVAYIAGKKNGNAVWRNSAKRRLRALLADSQIKPANCDFLMVAKSDILNIGYQDLLKECKNTINRINRYCLKGE
jgi:ribonuclease P protein component